MSFKLYICLPVLNESEQIPGLLRSLDSQVYKNFRLICCVNQPEEWWNDSQQKGKCLDNQKSIGLLSGSSLDVEIIDKSSKGFGWTGKKRGVGWARKLVMDRASEIADPKDLIVSIDADTFYPPDYFQSLNDLFTQDTSFTVHSNPYYHHLTGDRDKDRAILRYELYMRVYHINMMLIQNPFAFSALGSAMVCTAEQYLKMGGISPKLSGEDFYFIQHMRKNGPLSQYNTVKVFPQARFSDRVNFGTGPAMIKGNNGDWSSYPFYLPIQFLQIKNTFDQFEDLFDNDIDTPLSEFLNLQLKKKNPWKTLRENFKTRTKFKNACMQLLDGLRILQYLKSDHSIHTKGDEEDLWINLEYFSSLSDNNKALLRTTELEKKSVFSIDVMKELREALETIELNLRFEQPII